MGGLVSHDHMVETQPGFGFAIQWIPAHTSLVDVAKGRISFRNRLGNIAADGEAKRAAREHPSNAPFNTALGEAEGTVRAATAYICQIGAWMRECRPDALNEAFAKPSVQVAGATSSGAAARETSQHQLQHNGKRWNGQTCGRHAATEKQRKLFAKTSCYVYLPPRAKIHASHALWKAGRLWFCARCGAFGGRVLRALGEVCKVSSAVFSVSRRRALRRLERGLHPRSKAWLCNEALVMPHGPAVPHQQCVS